MAIKQNYYPTRRGDQIIWHQTQISKAASYFATLQVPAADGAAYLAGNERILHGLETWRPAVINFDRAAASYVQLMLDGEPGQDVLAYPEFELPALPAIPPAVMAGALRRIFEFVGYYKKSKYMTPAILADLGWAGIEEALPDAATTQPVLAVEYTTGGKGNVLWKKGPFDGIVLEVNRGNGWVYLDTDLRPDYTDNWLPAAGQTAVVQYRGQYLYKGQPFGLKSQPVSITLTGE